MRVLAMTPEQINMLPPTERSTYIQIVSSFNSVQRVLLVTVVSAYRELLLVSRQDDERSFAGRDLLGCNNSIVSILLT